MRLRDHLFHRIDRAERVWDVQHSNQLRALVQQTVVLIDQQLARIVHRNHAQARALLFAQHLPGNDVRVMLHRRDDDLVALADELAAVAVHHEVDAFCGAAHKNTFAHVARVDKAFDLFASAFVSGGRFLAQVMNAAMNVWMLLFEVDAAAIDYYLWNLRRGGVVEIYERLAVDSLLQHGEVSADAFDVPGIGNNRVQCW